MAKIYTARPKPAPGASGVGPIYWNPPSELPECFDVIVKQEGYQPQQAAYIHRALPKTGGGTIGPGFFIMMGEGRVIPCDKVIGWIPLPETR